MGLLDELFKRRYSVEDITTFINDDLKIRKTQYTTEKNVENVIAKQLKEEFGDYSVHQQYNIGGFLGLKCDLDMFDGSIGIELKLAKDLSSASNIERLFGQVIYYNHRCYSGKLITLVVGTKKEYTKTLKEVEDLINELDITFIYKIIE